MLLLSLLAHYQSPIVMFNTRDCGFGGGWDVPVVRVGPWRDPRKSNDIEGCSIINSTSYGTDNQENSTFEPVDLHPRYPLLPLLLHHLIHVLPPRHFRHLGPRSCLWVPYRRHRHKWRRPRRRMRSRVLCVHHRSLVQSPPLVAGDLHRRSCSRAHRGIRGKVESSLVE